MLKRKTEEAKKTNSNLDFGNAVLGSTHSTTYFLPKLEAGAGLLNGIGTGITLAIASAQIYTGWNTITENPNLGGAARERAWLYATQMFGVTAGGIFLCGVVGVRQVDSGQCSLVGVRVWCIGLWSVSL